MPGTYSGRQKWSSAVAHDFENDVAHPRALLAPCLLLLLAESPGHGYELMERLKPLGFDWGGPGPIYRELRALENAGLVASAWSAPRAGPVPRVYELTAEGGDALDRCAANVVGLSGLLDQFLGRHRAL
jgi:DNA-binding PadR family transcriptional regulator